ncbi:MAG: response regulator [Calditrichaeota bacterium]|nr:response regulator [Calditrichota bacterium]
MFSKLSISKKLWLMTATIVMIFVVTFYFYFNLTVEKQFREGFLRKGISLVQTAAYNLGHGLYSNDLDYVHNLLKGLENDPDVSFVLIKDENKQTKYQSGFTPESFSLNQFAGSGNVYEYAEENLLVKQSIFFRDDYQGDIFVGFRLAWIKEKMNHQKKNLMLLSCFLGLLLFVIVTALAYTISNPLKKAADIIKKYSDKNGLLDLRLPVKGSDEIAQLGNAFNHLADNLDKNILELNRSKKYLETLFQLNPIPIIIANTLGEIEEVNENSCDFFGIDHDLLIQMNLKDFIQSEDLHSILNKIIEERENIRNFVTTMKMPDETNKVVELNVTSYVDENELIRNIILAAIDITEKIQIQREILHNQTKLQQINSELTKKTKELEKLSELNRKNANHLARLIDISQNMMRSSDSFEIIKSFADNSGGLLETSGCLIYNFDANVEVLVPLISIPQNTLSFLPDEIPKTNNILWRIFAENDSIILDSNQLLETDLKYLGLNRQNSLSVAILPVSEKDYRFGVMALLREGENPFRVEEIHLISTLATQTAILLDNRNLLKVLKEKAQSLENAYSELQRSQQQVIQLQKMESLGTLVGGIAHDFNNILGIILPNTDLIRNEINGSPAILRRIDTIAEATQRAADLTRQLLMFSRNQDIHLQIISPNQLITRLSDMFQRTLGKEYDIILNLNPDVTDIEGDENRLTQVLINLALNARDSMPEGGEITISTQMSKYKNKNTSKSQFSEYLCISMSDRGSGIKASDIDKIFDPFFTTKSVGKGTGLGLSVVYGIMQSHRGFVEVESTLNEGSTFKLFFPPARSKSIVDTEFPDKELLKGTETILIVDDEMMLRNSVKDILESLGYIVLQASSGMEAEKIVQDKKANIDVAIVDMSMPKMNGIETIRQIQNIDRSIKILLSSGHIEEEKMIPSDLQLEGVLSKPYRLNELAYKIRQILS